MEIPSPLPSTKKSSPLFVYLTTFSTFLNPYLTTLITIPLILLLIQPSRIFSTHGNIDPWIYFGYFKNLKQHLSSFPGTYYGTRLPWILLGNLAYKIFTPLVAKYFLFLLVYYTSTLSLYGILKRTIGLKTAFITTLFLAFNKHFFLSCASEYIDGFTIASLFLTLFFLTPHRGAKHPLSLFLIAGVFFSIVISTQLFLLHFFPFIGAYYLFFHRPSKLKTFLIHTTLFIIGLLFMSLFLCTINYLLCNDFFFYKHVWDWVSSFVNSANPWWTPFSQWKHLLNTYVLGMTVFISSLFSLFLSRKDPEYNNKRPAFLFSILFIFICGLYLYFEFIKKHPVLELYYYYSYLIPFMLLAFGGLTSPMLERLSSRQLFWLTIPIISLCFIEVYFCLKLLTLYESKYPLYWGYFLAPSLLCFLVMILARNSTQQVLSFLLLCFCLTFANGKNNHINEIEQKSYRLAKSIFLSINDGVDIVKKLDPSATAKFWYGKDNDLYPTPYMSISSSYLWNYRLINENFPMIDHDPNRFHKDLSEMKFFVFSENSSVDDQVDEALSRIGYCTEKIGAEIVKRGPIKFNIFHFKAEKQESTFDP